MRELTFKIVRRIGAVEKYPSGWAKELNLVSWNDREPKYDLRDWDESHEKMSRGITLTDSEAKALKEILFEEFKEV